MIIMSNGNLMGHTFDPLTDKLFRTESKTFVFFKNGIFNVKHMGRVVPYTLSEVRSIAKSFKDMIQRAHKNSGNQSGKFNPRNLEAAVAANNKRTEHVDRKYVCEGRKSGIRVVKMANKFKVSQGTIRKIMREEGVL